MTETWLAANRRVLGMAFVPLGLVGLVAAWAIGAAEVAWVRAIARTIFAAIAMLMAGLIFQLRQPRVSYRRGEVLFHLRPRTPVAVPVDAVEAFFLGQGEAGLPAVEGKSPETVNLVARISQRYPELEHIDVKPALGRWCGHYVTISGTWCEPLTTDVIRRLNRRLREVHEAERTAVASASREVQP